MFDEIKYLINSVAIDKVKNVGITSTLKAYASLNKFESDTLENSGWGLNVNILDKDGNFNVCILLKMLLEFFKINNKILLNVRL